jgi:tetratricopeptide (TPR) repeat protein
MSYRKHIGDAVRKLNEKWLPNGVQIRLFKWEDFPPEYRGKSKQQEYIDEMVLPSEICIFLFSDTIGKFTKRELEAKQAQDADAVHCYRVRSIEPKDKKNKKSKATTYVWHDEIIDELKKVCGTYKDLVNETAVANELIKLVEDYIANHKLEKEAIVPSSACCFYTTIPDDNADLRDGFSDTFRSLDDYSSEFLGIRCVLHDREKLELLAETDHYVPLMRENLSDSDYNEIETAVGIVKKQTEQLKSLTFFKNGSIYPKEPRIKKLFDKNEIFPVSYKNYDSLKSRMLEWLARENKKIVDAAANIDIAAKAIKANNNTIVRLEDIDTHGLLSGIADKANQMVPDIEKALNQKDWLKVKRLQHQYNTLNRQLSQKVNKYLNRWAFETSPIQDNDQKTIEAKINRLKVELTGKLSSLNNEKQANEVIKLLEQEEFWTRELVLMGFALPHRLLAVQMNEVSIYDTYIKHIKQPSAEDDLYKRIIDNADRFGLLEPVAEMMRMNYANSLARLSRIESAASYYKQAITNLKKIVNKSKIVWHNITEVYMHLCNLYADKGMHEELDAAYMEFKKYVESLDVHEYRIDYCLLAAMSIKMIPKHENGHDDEIRDAINRFDQASREIDIPIAHQNYGDVFVLLPNLIAVYFVNHCYDIPIPKNIGRSLDNAEKYALFSLQNAEKLMKVDSGRGLFSIGEALHQLGFIAIKKRNVQKAIDYYNQALTARKELYDLTEDYDMEPSIAQTQVNIGALLLENSCPLSIEERTARLNQALQYAKDAEAIYHRHIQIGIEMTECNYFEALQLEGTIHYALWEIKKEAHIFDRAIVCLLRCWKWNIAHPRNHYQQIFEDYSGEILRKHRIIT